MNYSSEAQERICALSLASGIRPKTEDEERTVMKIAHDALVDQDISVRLQACDALRWIGNPNAVEQLWKALEREREEMVRHQLEWVLNFLQREHLNH